MGKKIIFLDRDGTMNVDKGYTYKSEDYKLLEGVKDGAKKLVDKDFHIVILTSQSGIGRGMYSEDDYKKYMTLMLKELKAHEVPVLGVYHCPHHAEHGVGDYKKDCDCRKPKPGLVHQAEKDLGPFDYEKSWAIGDSVRDLEMAKNAHPQVRTILLPKNYMTEHAKEIERSQVSGIPDFEAQNFEEAVDYIIKNQD